MVVHHVARRSVTDQLYEQLRSSILSGELAPGERLPAERELTVQSGVNRQSVREALQRLRELGLVDIVHGDGVHVLDWRSSGGLTLLPLLLVDSSGAIDPLVTRSFMELRSAIGADAARCCAERSTPALVERLEPLVAAVESGADDPRLWGPAGFELWEAILAGSGNVAYQLVFNSLRSAVEAVGAVVGEVVDAGWAAEVDFRILGEALLPDLPEADWMLRLGHRQLLDAIAAGDGATAAATARRILDQGSAATAALLGPSDD